MRAHGACGPRQAGAAPARGVHALRCTSCVSRYDV